MPSLNPRFRPVPALAPLAVPEPEQPAPGPRAMLVPEEPEQAWPAGFAEDHEPERVAPMPRMRIMAASAGPSASAAPAAASQGTTNPGSHSTKRPFIGRLSITDWDINPYQVAKDLGVTK